MYPGAETPEARQGCVRFSGQVEYQRRRDVVAVPVDAVLPTPSGPVVYRRSLTGTAAIAVATGARHLESVEIVSGLAAGAVVSRRDLGAATEGS